MRKIIILLGLAAATGFADTINFTGLPIDHEFGTYNGFAYATVNGITGVLLVCDDYNHTTYVPSAGLQYDVSTLTGNDPLQYARFLNPSDSQGSIARYEQAALLVNGLRSTGPQSLVNLTAQYQYALWQLFTPTVQLPDARSQILLDDTKAAASTPSAILMDLYAHLRIYTPRAAYGSNQEFLAFSGDPSWQVVDPPPVTLALATPEPEAWILAGLGLAMLLVKPLLRYFRRSTRV